MSRDFQNLVHKAAAFSRATFGPGERTEGVIDHMTKEFKEILSEDTPGGRAEEWVDEVILAIDGLTRALQADDSNKSLDWVASDAVAMITAKYNKNEMRNWPDWRTADPNKAIEHVKGVHD